MCHVAGRPSSCKEGRIVLAAERIVVAEARITSQNACGAFRKMPARQAARLRGANGRDHGTSPASNRRRASARGYRHAIPRDDE